jgi:hypothetical protein
LCRKSIFLQHLSVGWSGKFNLEIVTIPKEKNSLTNLRRSIVDGVNLVDFQFITGSRNTSKILCE